MSETSYAPQKVRDAAKRAEELHREIYGPKRGEEPPAEGESPAPPAEAAYPQPQAPQTEQPPQPQQPQTTAEQDRDERSEYEKLQARYKTLQGKYNAEVPTLRRENQKLQSEKRQLEAELEQLRQAPPAQSQDSMTMSPEMERQLRDEFGDDFPKILRSIAAEEAKRMVASVTPRIENVERTFKEETEQQRKRRVYDHLHATVPGWEDINKSQEFHEWLAMYDPLSGQVRRNMLMAAFEGGDAERVAHFFESFKQESKVKDGVDTPSADTQRPASQDLSRFVSPTPSRQPAPQTVGTESQHRAPQWTREQIRAFYKDKMRGVFKNDPERARRIEESIFEAQRQGLVR